MQGIGGSPKHIRFFVKVMTAFSFVALQSTDIIPNSYIQMHGSYSRGVSLLGICSSRVGANSKGANWRIYSIEIYLRFVDIKSSLCLEKQPLSGGTCDHTYVCPHICIVPSTWENSPLPTSLSSVQSYVPGANFDAATVILMTLYPVLS